VIREATVDDAQRLSTLACSLISFLSSRSDGYLAQEFVDTLSQEAYVSRLSNEHAFEHFVYVVEGNIVGYISYVTMVEDTHIFHLFVDKNYHKMGIAKKLWNFMLKQTFSEIYTVNSALRAKVFYENLGFVNSALVQTTQDLEYQPMIMLREE
jgi:GNAT superfamily N-acetyltransferase